MAAILVLLLACGANAFDFTLPSSLPPHPRLLANASAIAALKAGIYGGALANLYEVVLNAGQSALTAPLTPYPNCTVVGACRNAAVFGAGAGYINTGAIQNIIVPCALLYRLNITAGNWTSRAIAEMIHLSSPAFPSWYWPVGQALERSALSFAVAVGYDWLYDAMSSAERASVETAIGSLALATRMQDERQGMWWTQDPLNWNINSNGPLVAAALAVADVPSLASLASQVIATVGADLPAAVDSWAPYGIWPEGPTYSSFTLGSQVAAASALLTATGSDGGLLAAPGVCEIGHAMLYNVGPSGNRFNWGDAHAGMDPTPPLYYTAALCGRPENAAFAHALNAMGPPGGFDSVLNLLWYTSMGAWADVTALPTAAVFADPSQDTLRGRKTHFGSFRSCWAFGSVGKEEGCVSPVWVAFKGGQNHFDDHGSQSHNNHGHLDVSTFVMESGPEMFRWAIDLGPDNYDYPLLSYFGRFRFGYHYTSSVGHNVLSFDGDTQHRRGSGAIVASNTTADPLTGVWAVIDTSSVHGGSIYSTRTFSMAGVAPFALSIQDEWEHPTALEATWTMHTTASVSIQGSLATLVSLTGNSSVLMNVTCGPARLSKWMPSTRNHTASVPHAQGTQVPVTWSVTTLALPAPQSSTYDNLPVFVLRATVPSAVGGIKVDVFPMN